LAIKYQLAEVDDKNIIKHVLDFASTQVLFIDDLKKHNFILDEKRDEGLHAIKRFLFDGGGHSVPSRAIATEVFQCA
jgi:hypothetical protein